jgi:hypothetical protein
MPLAVEAEEMRVQFLELDRAVEVRVLDEWHSVHRLRAAFQR